MRFLSGIRELAAKLTRTKEALGVDLDKPTQATTTEQPNSLLDWVKRKLAPYQARQRAAREYHRQVRYLYRHNGGASRKLRRATLAAWRHAVGEAREKLAELSAKLDKMPRMVPAMCVNGMEPGTTEYIPTPRKRKRS